MSMASFSIAGFPTIGDETLMDRFLVRAKRWLFFHNARPVRVFGSACLTNPGFRTDAVRPPSSIAPASPLFRLKIPAILMIQICISICFWGAKIPAIHGFRNCRTGCDTIRKLTKR